jgi:protoporphyrinogen oxidase
MDRRSFFQIGLNSSVLLVSGCSVFKNKKQIIEKDFDYLKISPLDRTSALKKQKNYSGDNPTYAHRILWNKEDWVKKAKNLVPSSHHKVVIVGGGISGLLSAYFLKDESPLILEQAKRLGGNSKGEIWEGIEYSLGAAYFSMPKKDSKIYKLLNDLDLLKVLNVKNDKDDLFELNNKFFKFEESHPAHEQFLKLAQHCKQMWENQDIKYPEIPARTNEELETLSYYDQFSFYEYVRKIVGPLKNEMHAFIEHYTWSTFSATSTEISASVVLNSFAAEFGEIAVLPGGNSAMTEALAQEVLIKNPNSIRTQTLVFDIEKENEKYHITFMDDEHDIQKISADIVIMSCPKFIAAKILNNIPIKKQKIIENANYRPYVVGNLLLDQPLKEKFYALFMLANGDVKKNDIEKSARLHLATDILNANFTDFNEQKSVLTFYRGIPFDGFRSELLEEGSYEKIKKDFQSQIHEVLNLLKIDEKNIHEFRLTRWGHPMPVIGKGFFKNKDFEILSEPIENIYFIEQDNWMCPVFEVCFSEAEYWCQKIKKSLNSTI